jgi:hypothetical protein
MQDVFASLNAGELVQRRFREIARVSGLVFQGYPGAHKSTRQLQASSGLFYEVFRRHDPGNLLLTQAETEVLRQELDLDRIEAALVRMHGLRLQVCELKHPSPFAFPLMVERFREQLSTEKLADRLARMLADGMHRVLAIGVADRFGDYGISGLCIMRDDRTRARATSTVDTLLLSCRVLGRGVEQAFIGWLAVTLQQHGIEKIEASYVRTQKNAQVADFFDRVGFATVSRSEDRHLYAADLPSPALPAAGLIPVTVAGATA